jgi:hypothetical protein
LLKYYLEGLEAWRRRKDLEQLHANARAKGVTVTPAMEKRYLAWLAKIETHQARAAAKLAAWHAKHPGFAEKVRVLIQRMERQYR